MYVCSPSTFHMYDNMNTLKHNIERDSYFPLDLSIYKITVANLHMVCGLLLANFIRLLFPLVEKALKSSAITPLEE